MTAQLVAPSTRILGPQETGSCEAGGSLSNHVYERGARREQRPAGSAPLGVDGTVYWLVGCRRLHRRYERKPGKLFHARGHWPRFIGDTVSPILRGRHELIAVDLPGFGESAAMPAGIPYDLAGYCTVLEGFCRELDIERPHVAGNSLGGIIALELARLGLVRSVTALSPAGFGTATDARRALAMVSYMRLGSRILPVPLIKALSRSTAGRFLLTNTVYARPGRLTPECAVGDTLGFRNCTGFEATMRNRETLHLAGDITDVPVTVGWGDKDRLLPPRQGVNAERAVPDARLVRLPGCGHTPMSDDPELVARVILDGAARTTAV